MFPQYTTTLGSSLLALVLFCGAAEAGKAGGGGSFQRSSAPAPQRTVVPKAVKAEPKIANIGPKVIKSEPKLARIEPVRAAPKSRTTPAASPVSGKVIAKSTAGGAAALTAAKMAQHPASPLAPAVDKSNHVSQASMDRFVAAQTVSRNAQTFTKADGTKYDAAMRNAKTLITDPSKGYKVEAYGDAKKAVDTTKADHSTKPNAKGDTGTIVINENNKTVFVPASKVDGPDRRTIVVNCNDCKVVVVGDSGKNVVDQRKIIDNGNDNKIILGSDRANGNAGQNGGSVTDGRQVIVNGNDDKVRLGGDTANGGAGQSGSATGQSGGNGGSITDNRNVIVRGNDDTVRSGKDTANGGAGGNGGTRGGNGGQGGTVNDNRQVDVSGNGNTVASGGADANGGRGGNGGEAGGNGGGGGNITVKSGVTDNGSRTTIKPGDFNADGGEGGSSTTR
jgi:hypothetical protein